MSATYEGTRLSFSLDANTGELYSIRSGLDLNGDQSSRDRPPGVARNTETGPGRWSLDMTLTKDVRLGGSDGSGRGPRLRFRARVNNLLNRSLPRAYGNVLSSPLFGLPTGYNGARTIRLSTTWISEQCDLPTPRRR